MNEPAPAYPKMLYRGGKPYGETGRGVPAGDTRVVGNIEEEAEALLEGFEPAFQGEPHAPPEDPEPQEPGPPVEAPNSLAVAIDYLDGQAGQNTQAAADASLSEAERADAFGSRFDAPEPAPDAIADADGDGHDDETGEFVAPQPRKSKRK